MKRFFSWFSITLVFTVVSMWLIIFFMPLPPLLANLPYSQAVYDANDRLLRITLSEDQQYRVYTPIKQFPKALIEATLLQERSILLLASWYQPHLVNPRRHANVFGRLKEDSAPPRSPCKWHGYATNQFQNI